MYLPTAAPNFLNSHLVLLIYDRIGDRVRYVRTTERAKINENLGGHLKGFCYI